VLLLLRSLEFLASFSIHHHRLKRPFFQEMLYFCGIFLIPLHASKWGNMQSGSGLKKLPESLSFIIIVLNMVYPNPDADKFVMS